MKLKNLLTTMLTLFVFTFLVNATLLAQSTQIYVDVTNGSDTYTGVNDDQ